MHSSLISDTVTNPLIVASIFTSEGKRSVLFCSSYLNYLNSRTCHCALVEVSDCELGQVDLKFLLCAFTAAEADRSV